MKYYLKRCGFQELGSVGIDGKPKRGRYLLTSKDETVLSFFPKLSKKILNDYAIIPIIPLYTGNKVYCNYVFHNSKYNAQTSKNNRDEYRIYLNKSLEDNQLYFKTEDIVIMREQSNIGNSQHCYYLYLIRNHSSEEYLFTSRLIEDSAVRGNYGIYEGSIPFFEDAVKKYCDYYDRSEILIDDSVTRFIASTNEASQENVFNTATFRDFVLTGYGLTCAISGISENSIYEDSLEAVYIRPHTDGGSCLPSNGIALANKLSIPFIKGEFTISDQYTVIVHPHVQDNNLKKFNGVLIRVPSNQFFRPDKENLLYHRKMIFGSFLQG